MTNPVIAGLPSLQAKAVVLEQYCADHHPSLGSFPSVCHCLGHLLPADHHAAHSHPGTDCLCLLSPLHRCLAARHAGQITLPTLCPSAMPMDTAHWYCLSTIANAHWQVQSLEQPASPVLTMQVADTVWLVQMIHPHGVCSSKANLLGFAL